jgi:hypothetical protein
VYSNALVMYYNAAEMYSFALGMYYVQKPVSWR